MAPVISALKKAPAIDCRVLATAQHRELLDQMLNFFEIEADFDLNIMTEDQSLAELTAGLMVALDKKLAELNPHLVIAQGDTTTVFTAALGCFYRKIAFGHVEAGLRTCNLQYPFPEEANRLLAGHLADLHFAPTETGRTNLLAERVPPETIHVTGNTVIDALLLTADKNIPLPLPLDESKKLILVTAHRRDSFGAPMEQICRAVQKLCERFSDIEVLWPVHPNPSIRPVVETILHANHKVHLCEPLSYGEFVTAMKRSHLILTDSGGVQEEAPALGKPVLVLRRESERPEALDAGVAQLVGPDEQRIFTEASRLLEDPSAYQQMAKGASPYGDGRAAERISRIIQQYLA